MSRIDIYFTIVIFLISTNSNISLNAWLQDFSHYGNHEFLAIESCDGNGGLQQQNCNTNSWRNLRNVFGTLALTAVWQDQTINNQTKNITSASITTTKSFDFKQLDIRMAMPSGSYLRPALILEADSDVREWPKKGQIDFLVYVQKNPLVTGVHGDFSGFYMEFKYDSGKDFNYHDFHTYSLERNASALIWSIDNTVIFVRDLSSVKFSADYNPFTPGKKFRLNIALGVAGVIPDSGLPLFDDNRRLTEADAQSWHCPALIVQYIKVIEWNKQEDNLTELGDPKALDICQIIKPNKAVSPDCPLYNSNLIIVLVVVSIVLSVMIIAILVFTRIKMYHMVSIGHCHHDDIYIAPDNLPVPVPSPLIDHMIRSDRLDLLDEIGDGHFGVVIKGSIGFNLNKGTKININVAIKKLKKGFLIQQDIGEFLEEAVKMKNFSHEHVIGLIGICFNDGFPILVLPFMKFGSLVDHLKKNRIDTKTKMRFASEIAQGMQYLRSQQFIHRDLAARNCLLDEEEKVKISDFGLSKLLYEKDYYRVNTNYKLPMRWIAVECFEDWKFTFMSDVWSYGVVLWEIFNNGAHPYSTWADDKIIPNLKCGQRLEPTGDFPPGLYDDLVIHCWKSEPKMRPEFTEIISYLNKYEDNEHSIARNGMDSKAYVNLSAAINWKPPVLVRSESLLPDGEDMV